MSEAMPEIEPKGMLPLDPDPIGSFLDNKLLERQAAEGERPTADGLMPGEDICFRGSYAGSCSRQIALKVIGHPVDIPLEVSSLRIFDIGHHWHDNVLGPALVEMFGAELEVPASYMPGFPLSCWGDGLIDREKIKPEIAQRYGFDRFPRTGVENKSVSSYGFDLAAGVKAKYGELPGPKFEHVAQSALFCTAPGIEADGMFIVYAHKERGEIASWLIGVDDPLPHLGGVTPREIAISELRRFAGILSRIEAGELARPVIPGHGLVTNPPAKGSRGQPWSCRYCPYQPTCEAIGPDVVALSRLTETETKCL